LTQKQTQAIEFLEDQETNQLLFGGGAGGAKSFLGCYWTAKNCLKYPGSRWIIGRKSLKTLKETTLVTFFDVCKMVGLKKDTHFVYKEQKGQIIFLNESQVLLKDLFRYPSDPNFDSLGSLEITGAFIDECNQIDDLAKEILNSRIRYKLEEFGLIPKLLMTCNPDKNWVYSEFYKPNKEGTLSSDKKFIQALATDNPYISKLYIESLEKMKYEAKRQRLLYGNWDYDDDEATLFHFDKVQDSFSNTFVSPKPTKYLSCDIAMHGSDLFVVGLWEGLVCTNIYSFEKTDGKEVTDQIVKIAKENKIPNSRIVYDADGMGSFLGGYLKSAKAFHNGARAKGKENYENLKTQCYYKLAELFETDKIAIQTTTEIQEKISQELTATKQRDQNKDGKLKITKKEDIKRSIGRSPDYADMIAMRMFFEIKVKIGGYNLIHSNLTASKKY